MPTPSKLHQPTDLPWHERAALTVTHAAEVLGLSRKDTYNAVAAGRIRAVNLGGKRIVVPVAEIWRLVGEATDGPKRRRAAAAARKDRPLMHSACPTTPPRATPTSPRAGATPFIEGDTNTQSS